MRTITLITLMLVLAGPAAAQEEPWTLRRCIDYAREHNIEIKRQRLSEEDAALALRQSKLDYAPSLNAGANYNMTVGRALDPTTYDFLENETVNDLNGALSLSADLFGGMRKMKQLRRDKMGLEAALLATEKTANDLELNVTAAYLEILLAGENVKISHNRIATLEGQSQRTHALVNAGRSTLSEQLQIDAQLADARTEALSYENQLILARFNLCQLLERDDYRTFRIVQPDSSAAVTAALIPDEAYVLDAAQALPQIGAAELQTEIAEQDIRIARSAFYPTLGLSAGYGSTWSDARKKYEITAAGEPIYKRYPFREQIKDNASGYISFSLGIPIFSSLTARARVKSGKIAAARAEYDLELAQKQLRKEVQQALIDARSAFERYRSSTRNVEASREAFRAVEQKFDIGAATSVDYSVALDNLVKAEGQLVQAKYEYLFKTRILDFYSGRPIEL